MGTGAPPAAEVPAEQTSESLDQRRDAGAADDTAVPAAVVTTKARYQGTRMLTKHDLYSTNADLLQWALQQLLDQR